jgi:hypothetical protein
VKVEVFTGSVLAALYELEVRSRTSIAGGGQRYPFFIRTSIVRMKS